MTCFDVVSAHEITIYIIQHFIGVDIAVVVRCWNRIRMVIIQTWNKRANHKRTGFKGLMDWRWLMDSSCNRLEIVNRKCIRIVKSIISNYIKRMCGINHIKDFVLLTYFYQEITLFVMGFYFFRTADIALTKRRMLQQLSKPIAVSFCGINRMTRLYNKQTVVVCIRVNFIDNSARNHYIVTLFKIYMP